MVDLRVGLVKVDDMFHPHNVRRDLGDLRSLTNSIVRYGIMQPVVVEKYGDKLRLRAGSPSRRTSSDSSWATRTGCHPPRSAAGQGLADPPAVGRRAGPRRPCDVRADAVQALRRLGCSWSGIADAFGVTPQTAANWVTKDHTADPESQRQKARNGAHRRATVRLRDLHRDEYEQLVREELAGLTIAQGIAS